jgi:hypothetical protein
MNIHYKSQKTRTPQEENSAWKDYVNDENAVTLEYSNIRTNSLYQFQQINSCLRIAK